MDNNQNNNGPQFINPQPSVPVPTPPQGPLQQPQTPNGITPPAPKIGFMAGKMKFLIIGAVILVLLLVVFGVFMMTRSSTDTPSETTKNTSTEAPGELEKLTKLEKELSDELDALDLGSVDQDFTDVDQQLSSL